jgi:low temperature requirement protein LtrA
MTGATPSIVSPEDQPATFVELFFDLVFVFSVTQVVGLVGHHLTWGTVGEAVLVFWLVWWAWTQFTWTLNAADTEHPAVRLVTLAATGVAFLMAVTLPDAFSGRALWFAVPYVVVRLLGLGLQVRVARAHDPGHHSSVRLWAVLSLGGLAAVMAGGLAGGEALYWLWGLVVVLDLIAAAVGGEADRWFLHPGHFAERHGLFVIIALGETLIVAAAGLSEAAWNLESGAVAVLAVATSCGLWWTYFPGPLPAVEEGLRRADPAAEGALARSALSLLHFPMVLGLIGYAIAVETALARPAEALPVEARMALATGVLFFVGGGGLAAWRATGRVPGPRLAATVGAAAALVAVGGVPPAVSVSIALTGVILVVALERRAGEPYPGGPA